MKNSDPDLLTWNPFDPSKWPRSIVSPADYDGSDHLCISYDLGVVPEKEKKMVIKQWCSRLPELQNLRWLCIWSHVTQPLFDAACKIANLECLQIKWSNVKSLHEIERLKNILYLHMGSSTKVESIQPLAALSSLRLLHIENFKLISDFSPLLKLTSLESLTVSGSMWTRQNVGSLDAFSRMTWLKDLAIDISNINSIQSLASLKNLKVLGIGGKLPMQEYAWLAAKLPHTKCFRFTPYLDLAGSGMNHCERCKQDSKVMLTGKGGKVLCRFCDKDKVEKHVAAFNAAKQSVKVASQ